MLHKAMPFEPIAIVGRSCVLPGALTPQALWDAVLSGQDLITNVPQDRWRMSQNAAMGTPEHSDDRTWSNRGGYVRGFDEIFDPSGFALDENDIKRLDPLFKWVLHTAREALKDAGITNLGDAGAVVGNLSFPSSGMSAFAEQTWLGATKAAAIKHPETNPKDRFMSGLPAHLVAEALELGQPAYALDAACASSLYAIKLACDKLHDGDADVMLAGAVNRADDLFLHVGFCALKALSTTGQSRPFHKEANGLVPGDGAAFVVLKRLADARKDGDRILGVIRGVGLSNDGRGMGFLAPSADGQERAIRLAYEQSGLAPSDISLIECHATGTTVGDKTEIESTARVFDGLSEIPIGSLKSNTGHLITAAGMAGLIKVLGAIETETRPPSLHAEQQNEALVGSPFRVLTKAEPWDCDGIRRAGISAFGFGGNNAHLIVEAHDSKAHPSITASPVAKEPIAIVGLSIAAAQAKTREQFAAQLLDEAPQKIARMTHIEMPLKGLKFPPKDLKSALPQQLLLLKTTMDAVAEYGALDTARSGVFVGMGCDPEVARYGARWRAADWANTLGDSSAQWTNNARDAIVPLLQAPGVLGTMPNIVANRLNSQLNLTGLGLTLSSEELSGLRALEVASRALNAGELDLAIVGAVDMSVEPVHQAALDALNKKQSPGDGAVVLILQRLSDAKAQQRDILAVLDPSKKSKTALPKDAVASRFGVAHAAYGLMQVAAATIYCASGQSPNGKAARKLQHIGVAVDGMAGQSTQLTVSSYKGASMPTKKTTQDGPVLTFDAHWPEVTLPEQGQAKMTQSWPEVGLKPIEPVTGQQYDMAPAPKLPPIVERPNVMERPVVTPAAQSYTEQPAIPATPQYAAQPAGAAAPQVATTQQIPLHSDFHARVVAHQAQVASLHQQFVAQQAQVQSQFLSLRQTSMDALLQNYQHAQSGTQVWTPVVEPAVQPAIIPAPQAPQPQTTRPAPAAKPPVVQQPPQQQVIPAEPSKPAFTLNRQQLEVHSSGKISTIYGPIFEQQDGYERQVRMPEPPLLLADRVTGLDAEAGSMGTGSIQTETDVCSDSWYLHDGRMPAGIMIESGQADLMLISYLGIDFLNKSDRVYRLLGCELTYHGHLPKAGETIHYDIHVDGHAAQGDVRLFFFHYDCTNNGRPQLTVRGGQAGFFTDEELANSEGVLWSAETGEHCDNPRLDPPAVQCQKTQFGRRQLEAFAAGDVTACFGAGFEGTQTHTRTPRVSGGRMLFLDQVTHFETAGGPWQRGYLRAVDPIAPDDWFFDGHFKNDPCMPGTLMFEGCLQAMAFYITGLGYTVDKDGWRFEPVPDETYQLRCRGQVTPTSKNLEYEIFVEEVIDGPYPTIYADLLCTVDGLKAFHCRRMGLRLVPGWPLDSRPELLEDYQEPKPVAAAKGFDFDYASLLACAWGRPSKAFGPMYQPFDDTRRVARLPGPPYHFMSRVSYIDGDIGVMKPGAVIEIEYDIDPKVWYFRDNGSATMPYCVLLEAALQPCGWLASFVGSALTVEEDLFFRNLDGTGTLKAELLPDSGTLRTRVKITNVSKQGGMIIESFDAECFIGDTSVYEMKTVFGFFPKEALAKQVGLPISDEQQAFLTDANDFSVDLTQRPERYCGGELKLPSPFLLMLDRVTGYWPQGGEAGLGRFRAEKDVDVNEWFFKAHFHQDPVQPGSLGIEAMIQLLQFAMLEKGMDEGIEAPRFEPIALGQPLTWKYRGQVRIHNKTINTTLEITEEGQDDGGPYAIAKATLWVDGMRIYEASNVGMRIVSGAIEVPGTQMTMNPKVDTWLNDHCPTWTLPALPLMSMVDQVAAAGTREGRVVVGLKNVKVNRWLAFEGAKTITNHVVGGDGTIDVSLHDEDGAFASGTVLLGTNYTQGPAPLDALDAPEQQNPYDSGELFHGPAFHLLESLKMDARGASGVLNAGAGSVPTGALNQALLDATTHCIPHDRLHLWCDDIPADQVAYPALITEMTIHGTTPTEGSLRCEVRFDGFFGGARFPAFKVQLIGDQRVWCAFRLVEALFPKGPIGCANPLDRRAFLRDRQYVEGVALSNFDGKTTRLDPKVIEQSNWLAGTIDALYGTEDPTKIATKEHFARKTGIHPGLLPHALPLNTFEMTVKESASAIVVKDAEPICLDVTKVNEFWSDWLGVDSSPVHDAFLTMLERFVRQIVVVDPKAYQALEGRSVLYVANHQVAVESVLFLMAVSALTKMPSMALAKAEHRDSWIGQLIESGFTYPGMTNPELMQFFDRSDPAALPKIVERLSSQLSEHQRSMLVHVEGTRSLAAGKPVETIASVFIDMAVAAGIPIVPVRFCGGLPQTPADSRLEFPLDMGSQDYWLGRPILPETLQALTPGERKRHVIDAMNSMGPKHSDEQPNPGDKALIKNVNQWMKKTGVSQPKATLMTVLNEMASPCAQTKALLKAVTSGSTPKTKNKAQKKWLTEMAQWLSAKDSKQ